MRNATSQLSATADPDPARIAGRLAGDNLAGFLSCSPHSRDVLVIQLQHSAVIERLRRRKHALTAYAAERWRLTPLGREVRALIVTKEQADG